MKFIEYCFTTLCILASVAGVIGIIVGVHEKRKPEIIVGAIMTVVGIASLLALYVWNIPMF